MDDRQGATTAAAAAAAGSALPAHRGRPLVRGAVGRVRDDVLARLLEGAGPLPERVSRPGLRLLSDLALRPLEGTDPGWSFASASGTGRDLEPPGVRVTRRTVSVRTDWMGLQDVYYRIVGGAAYFAQTVEPLLRLDASLLDVDWEGWAGVWYQAAPVGDATVFRQVRRLTGGQEVRFDRLTRRLTVESIDGTLPDVPSHADPGALHEAVVRGVERSLGDRDVVDVTLSGGWDSRIIAVVAARSGRRLRTWTTDPDDRSGDDVEMARAVAAALGSDHREVLASEDDWPRMLDDVAARLDWQVNQHAWLGRLAEEMRGARAAVVDGVAGDALIKGMFTTDRLLAAGSDAERMLAMRRRLERPAPRLAVLDKRGHAWAHEAWLRSFDRATERLVGHPRAPLLSALTIRTARGASRSPLSLFAPECSVAMPFLDPDIVAAALAFSDADKAGGGVHRELLRRIDPLVAALPSTNDAGRAPNPRRSHQDSPSVHRAVHRGLQVAEEIPGLLSPHLVRDFRREGVEATFARRDAWWLGRYWLRGLRLFGGWYDVHRDVLRTPEAPWL